MTNLFAEMNKEVAEHFTDKKEKTTVLSGFKSYYANGRKVIDLTSCDFEYEPTKLRMNDIERQGIYGNKAGDKDLM